MGSVAIPAGRHAVLTFALPEDERVLRDALAGERWHAMVWDLDQALRQVAKYHNGPEQKHAEWARAQLREAIHAAGLAEELER